MCPVQTYKRGGGQYLITPIFTPIFTGSYNTKFKLENIVCNFEPVDDKNGFFFYLVGV